MTRKPYSTLSRLCLLGGFGSLLASILIWFLFKSPDPAYGERFGIFVGLWAPTLFALSNRFESFALQALPLNASALETPAI